MLLEDVEMTERKGVPGRSANLCGKSQLIMKLFLSYVILMGYCAGRGPAAGVGNRDRKSQRRMFVFQGGGLGADAYIRGV